MEHATFDAFLAFLVLEVLELLPWTGWNFPQLPLVNGNNNKQLVKDGARAFQINQSMLSVLSVLTCDWFCKLFFKRLQAARRSLHFRSQLFS